MVAGTQLSQLMILQGPSLSKKGFALVLVLILAGFIFLLGASLVVVTRLQTAASDYDNRVRLAQEHARSAINIALAELQQHAGKDAVVTYSADVYREVAEQDFDLASSAEVSHPFWMAADDGVSPVWMVSGEWDGRSYSPLDSLPSEVTLVGEASVDSDALKVTAPKVSVDVQGLSGYPADQYKTIGNYAYWTGDLGVKASYTRHDRSEDTLHDEYAPEGEQGSSFRQQRLRQVSSRAPRISSVDTSFGENPGRIDRFVHDFQFREAYGASSSSDWYLDGLSETELRRDFHDFTPLSKGLLSNSASGGWRRDLSSLEPTSQGIASNLYDSSYLSYAAAAKSLSAERLAFDDVRFAMRGPGSGKLPVHPVMTQLNLNYSIYLAPVAESEDHELRLSFWAGFEFWNPFSSRLAAEGLRVEIKGLPQLEVSVDLDPETRLSWAGALDSLSRQPSFLVPDFISGSEYWRPGQVAAFSGPAVENPFALGPFPVSETSARSLLISRSPLAASILAPASRASPFAMS